jgi:hypothetical protein
MRSANEVPYPTERYMQSLSDIPELWKKNPPEHEVSVSTIQSRFVTHESGSWVGIITKLWAGRRRNHGSNPNWYRRSVCSPKRLPRGQSGWSVKLITHVPSKVNLKNKWSYTPTFQTLSWRRLYFVRLIYVEEITSRPKHWKTTLIF